MKKYPVQKWVKALKGLERWSHRCHEASLALIRTGLLPKDARVARGTHPWVRSQHSWVVLGDPYSEDSTIIDPTLWSYIDKPSAILIDVAQNLPHRPKGFGSIWEYGRPDTPTGPIIRLEARLSKDAQDFLETVSPIGLDFRGWMTLANSPVGGWPAKEIITAMYKDKKLSVTIPIDIVGMVTDLNPCKLYW